MVWYNGKLSYVEFQWEKKKWDFKHHFEYGSHLFSEHDDPKIRRYHRKKILQTNPNALKEVLQKDPNKAKSVHAEED